MTERANLLADRPEVVNVGLKSFFAELRQLGVPAVHVDWQPPAQGDPVLGKKLAALEAHAARIAAANREALGRLLSARPVWVDVGPAIDTIPGFTPTTILHAGPPIEWEQMCGPMKGAIAGALVFEGLANDLDEAMALAGSGKITFAPCHHFGAVGPMAGVISASMPVIVVENKEHGNKAYSNFNNEGGRATALSFGFCGPEAVNMLRWQRDVLGPAFRAAIRAAGELDLQAIMAKALQMGDDVHNRHVASTSLLLRYLLPSLAKAGVSHAHLSEIADLLVRNDWFFLNFSMAACKASADAARDVPGSTMVTAMARNGVEVGIRISGLGDRWFTAPAPPVKGLYFAGYTAEDANPDLGDSAITETCGLGAFAMAAAPAMTRLVGGSVAEAINYTREMAEITLEANPSFTIPHLDFQGTPTGIDLRKVLETGITPIINTGIAHKVAGKGMVGAGMVRIPVECFTAALDAYLETLTSEGEKLQVI
ncbi:MAG: DUF1116 domain-containing protein [Betaproteobacteria bacterium]